MLAKSSTARVLVVEDDTTARVGLLRLLRQRGFRADGATDGPAALDIMAENTPDVVVTDYRMPRMNGIELTNAITKQFGALPVILVTGFSDADAAIHAMRAGAADLIRKPVHSDQLVASIKRALERDRPGLASTTRPQPQAQPGTAGSPLDQIVGDSPAMQEVRRVAALVAPTRATVLITGESGTGKGDIAKAIHAMSPRAASPFVPLHCAALAESLLESELFGHERGSFTGADRRRLGRFEQADGGTLFLDEIGEIPPAMQVKLLRVLQERSFERVGGAGPVTVDVRLIAATNRDLRADVAAGRFREDLLYRLDVVHIQMPRLASRGDDIFALAGHFLARLAADHGRSAPKLSEGAKRKLRAHSWPGNVRELENAMERAIVLARGDVLSEEDIPIHPVAASQELQLAGKTMAEIEKQAILAALQSCGGSTSRAAEILGISVRTIQYRLHEYGLAGRHRKAI